MSAGAPREPGFPPLKTGAILAGWATDLGLSLVFGALVAAIVTGGGSFTPEEVAARVAATPGLQLSTLLVGLGFTGVGGYVAATLAKERPLTHATAVGLLSLGFGVALSLLAPSDAPLWYQAAGLGLTVPAAALGGWVRR